MAIDGDNLIVGAYAKKSINKGINPISDIFDHPNDWTYRDVETGAACLFTRVDHEWHQQAYIKASHSDGEILNENLTNGEAMNGLLGDRLANAVDVSNGTIAVGSLDESSSTQGIQSSIDDSDNSVTYSGAAYVYQ